MRHALLPLFLATPASAQSVADFGGTGCRLIPVEGQSQVADVICHNAVTSGEKSKAADFVFPGPNNPAEVGE